jgi:DNA-binding NtrC family response regulator
MNPENPNSSKTILFADADGSVQKFIAGLLNKNGYHVILAGDGLAALRKAREYDGVIHMLLSDVEMPGMTGIELAIQLGRERPDTKILLFSGLESGILVLNNGWQFLPKPFMADMLRDRIRDFLTEQPSLQEHLASVLAEVKKQPALQGHAEEVTHLAEILSEVVPEAGPVLPTNGAPPPK